MKLHTCRRAFWLFPILIAVLAIGVVVSAQPTSANEAGPGTAFCAQPRFNASDGANRNGKLNCTANDVSLTAAGNANPASCEQGSTIAVLTFDVDIELNANSARTDLGFYFNTGTSKTNGARGGGTSGASCQIVTIDPNDDGYVSLDDAVQPTDVCGDIDGAHSPTTVTITLTNVACQGVTNPANTNQLVLLLPYCSSWFIPGADLACTGALNAWPSNGAKCKCDDNFLVPVVVTAPSGSVVKTATKATVRYSVTVTNTSAFAADVFSLNDSHYNNITTTGHDGIVATTCNAGDKNLEASPGPGNTYTCTFDVEISNPGSATPVSNKVTAVLRRTGTTVDTPAESNQVNVVVDLNAPAP
jgi:hypothetical protein